MELVGLKPEHIPQLTRLLNQHLHRIVPQFSLSEHKVQSVVFDRHHSWHIHYDSQPPSLKTQQYGIIEQNQLIAAAQWDIPLESNLSGTLSWIVSQIDKPQAIRLLIQQFQKQLQTANCDEAQLTRFHFGVGWLGFPDTWTHIHQGLTEANFWVHDTWEIWTGDINDILSNPIKPPDDITLIWDINSQNREWDLYLHKDDIEVGTCSAWELPSIFDDEPTASEWMTIEYLEVKPDYRRQHLAQFMLYKQAQYHAKLGVQNFIAWIQQTNTPALNFVRSLGFTQQFITHDYTYTGTS